MGDEKTPLDQLLDLVFYAPVGLAVTALDELPQLVEKGRARVTGQVAMARMIGQFAVAEGQRQATSRLRQVSERLQSPARLPDSRPAPSQPASRPAPAPPAPAPSATPPSSPAPAPAASNGTHSAAGPATNGHASTPAHPPAGARPDGTGLAIPGYDTLSASQVVQRLAGLAAEELEAVRAYESSTRGRRTILNRIVQLQNDSDARS